MTTRPLCCFCPVSVDAVLLLLLLLLSLFVCVFKFVSVSAWVCILYASRGNNRLVGHHRQQNAPVVWGLSKWSVSLTLFFTPYTPFLIVSDPY